MSAVLWSARVYLLLSNGILWIASRLLFWRMGREPASRILAVRTGGIGDLVVCLPALAFELRKSSTARIWMFTSSRGRLKGRLEVSGSELIAGTRYCERVIPFSPHQLGMWQDLKAVRGLLKSYAPDRVVFISGTVGGMGAALKKMVILALLGVRVRPEGWHIRATLSLAGKQQFDHSLLRHQVVGALLSVGGPVDGTPLSHPLDLPEYPDAVARTNEVLRDAGVPAARPYFLLGISAKREHKCWPIESFAEVAEAVASEFGWYPVAIGGHDDAALGEAFVQSLRCPAASLCGKLRLKETVEAARRAVLYVGNDSGPAHLAAGAGIPVVTIFSGIHYPGIWEPWTTRGEVVRRSVPCAPCMSETSCPNGSMRCMREISVSSVLDSIRNVTFSGDQPVQIGYRE